MSDQREPLRILVFAASLRAESLNARLARLAADAIERRGATADLGAMRDFDAPSYDGDIEASDGMPSGPRAFCERLEAAHGFVIVSPEYNASMPGVLKNAIDWVSRARPQPFNERHGLLLSASPSMVGGNRGLWSLRIPLEHLGARIYPDKRFEHRLHNHGGGSFRSPARRLLWGLDLELRFAEQNGSLGALDGHHRRHD